MKTVKTIILIPSDILEQAKRAAEERQKSFSVFVTTAIRQALRAPSIHEDVLPSSSFLDDDSKEIPTYQA